MGRGRDARSDIAAGPSRVALQRRGDLFSGVFAGNKSRARLLMRIYERRRSLLKDLIILIEEISVL